MGKKRIGRPPAKPCRVCEETDYTARIDAALASGLDYGTINRTLGGFYIEELRYHEEHRLKEPEGVRKLAKMSPDDLLRKFLASESTLKRIAKDARKQKDPRTAVLAIREQVRIGETIAKLEGYLRESTASVNVNVNVGPLPDMSEIATRLSRLDTPEAAQRRALAAAWLASGSEEDWRALSEGRALPTPAETPLLPEPDGSSEPH